MRVIFRRCFRWVLIWVGLAAAIFAKNSISCPLSYDYSCSYGFPMAWLEIYSINGIEHMGFVTQAYRTNATAFATPSVWINILMDVFVFAMIYRLLQDDGKKSEGQKILRRSSWFLFVLFAMISWIGILAPWETQLYRHCYLADMVLLGGLILLGAMKLLFYKMFKAKMS